MPFFSLFPSCDFFLPFKIPEERKEGKKERKERRKEGKKGKKERRKERSCN